MRTEDADKYDPLKRLWTRLSTRAPRFAMVVAVVLALAAALDWITTGSENIDKVLSFLGLRTDPQQLARLLILKGQYPLEPLSAYFDIEYKMDDKMLTSYAKRFEDAQLTYFNGTRTHNDLRQMDALFIISGLMHAGPANDLPGDVPGEEIARKSLLTDSTELILSVEANNGSRDFYPPTTIRFACMSPQMQKLIVTLPSFGDVEQAIEVYADFRRRVFIKHVRCRNLPRLGPNSTAKSALDLIGRHLRWTSLEVGLADGKLTKIAFVFPFSPTADDFEQHYIKIPEDQTSIMLTDRQLGFHQLLSEQ